MRKITTLASLLITLSLLNACNTYHLGFDGDELSKGKEDDHTQGILEAQKVAFQDDKTLEEVLEDRVIQKKVIQSVLKKSPTNLLRWAILEGYPEVALIAIHRGSKVNIRVKGATPLMYATYWGHKALVEALLKAKASINSRSAGWHTALIVSVCSGSSESSSQKKVDVELEKYISDLDWGDDYLYFSPSCKNANSCEHKEILKALIKAGAKLNYKDKWGHTALMQAVTWCNRDALVALLKAGANPNLKENMGRAPLHTAVSPLVWPQNARDEKAFFVRALLQEGADVNIKNGWGRTPVMRAARIGDEEIMKILIQAGADVNRKDEQGNTALMQAASSGKTAVLQTLIQAGAAIDTRNLKGQTALMIAEKSDNKDFVTALLKAGANPNSKENLANKAFRNMKRGLSSMYY